MQPATPAYRMADRLAGGQLAEVLTEHVDAGRSFDQISRILFADYGIEASRPTLESWHRKLTEPSEAAS